MSCSRRRHLQKLFDLSKADTSVVSPVEVSTEAVAEQSAEPEKVAEVAESDSTDDAPGKEKDLWGLSPPVGWGAWRAAMGEKLWRFFLGKRCGKHKSSRDHVIT